MSVLDILNTAGYVLSGRLIMTELSQSTADQICEIMNFEKEKVYPPMKYSDCS